MILSTLGLSPHGFSFGLTPKGLIPMEIFVHPYIPMILPTSNQCGTLFVYPTRRIRMADDSNQLIWGKQGGSNFTLKEARNCIEDLEQDEKVNWSNKVWDSQFWPKIKTFLWLLMHRKTLTWENLRKKGLCGPSRCPMCEKEEETMNHLFNTCEVENLLWNWAETILKQMDRTRDSIQETIENW